MPPNLYSEILYNHHCGRWVYWPHTGFPFYAMSLCTPHSRASLVAAVQEEQEMQVQSLGQKDPLEEGIAAHSSILAWRSPWTEEPDGLQSIGLQRLGHNQCG